MSIFFEILVRIASYGPQIDQSHGENRLSHIIIDVISFPLLIVCMFDPFFKKKKISNLTVEKETYHSMRKFVLIK